MCKEIALLVLIAAKLHYNVSLTLSHSGKTFGLHPQTLC